MITILARETSWSHHAIVYEKDGKNDVFFFPLDETFASAEERLNDLLAGTAKKVNSHKPVAPSSEKSRRPKIPGRAADGPQIQDDTLSERESGGNT